MLLFWFDYLTADMLGVFSMCIEKVQNKPTILSPKPHLVKVIYSRTEDVFKQLD